MPQGSYGFAVGRVRVLEQSLLGRQALDRLSSAQSAEEIGRALQEFGWGEAKTKEEIDGLCDRQVAAACKLIRDDSPDPRTTDCFLLKYDILNLKLLIKSRALGEPQDALSPCGVIDPERLRRAVSENNYIGLPEPIKQVMTEIEKHIAAQMDPLYVDAQLDKAMYAIIHCRLQGVKDGALKRYFTLRADLTNLLIALRSAQMGRGASFARGLLVSGGELDLDALARVADEPERAVNLVYMKPYAPAVRDALASARRSDGLAALEKRADDLLLALVRPCRYESQSVLPLVGYLLAREREATAVRLIAVAKAARVSSERLAERLRELYA